LGVWALREWWRYQKVEQWCESAGSNSMEDIIACIALPPHLEVPLPATACCGPIRIFEGGPSLDSNVRAKIPPPPLSMHQHKDRDKLLTNYPPCLPTQDWSLTTNPFQFSIKTQLSIPWTSTIHFPSPDLYFGWQYTVPPTGDSVTNDTDKTASVKPRKIRHMSSVVMCWKSSLSLENVYSAIIFKAYSIHPPPTWPRSTTHRLTWSLTHFWVHTSGEHNRTTGRQKVNSLMNEFINEFMN